MALRIYTGGTTGATDGTLEVGGDQVGLTLDAGQTNLMHLRCASGEQTAEVVVVNAPTGCQVSSDGVTFGATATYPAGSIQDANVACHVKRTVTGLTADEVRSGTTTPRLALAAVEPIPAANAAPAAFTPTVSSVTATGASVAFATTDPNGDTLTYKVAVTTSATPPSDWSGYSDVTSPQAVSGLNAETTYYAHVRAFDGELATVGTSEAFTTTAAGDTTAPAISGTLTATPTATQGQVALAGPTATDAVGIAKWQYQVDAGAWVDVASTSTTFPTTNVSGLSIGLHDFAVRAVDTAANASTTKTASATVADITAPAISGTLTATVNSTTQVTLAGPTATDNVGIAKWQYRIGTGSWVDVASTSGTFPSTAVTGLTPATAYTFEVRALDAAGNASTAKSASATTESDAPIILTGTLTATASGNTITLDWPDATGDVGPNGYDVEYGTTTSYGSSITDPTTSSATISGLNLSTLYYIRVRAYDSIGNTSDWLTASATTQASAVVFTDNFNRANSNTIGNGWTQFVGANATLQVYNNQLKVSAATSNDAANIYRSVPTADRATAGFKYVLTGVSNVFVGLYEIAGLNTDAGQNGYEFYLGRDGGTLATSLTPRKIVNAAPSSIGSAVPVTVVEGDILEIRYTKSTALFELLHNETVVFSVTDGTHASKSLGYLGLRMFVVVGHTATIDDIRLTLG